MLESQRAVTAQYEFSKGTFRSLFSDLKSGLRDTQDGWDAVGNAGANALDKVADRALGMAADGIFDMIFGAITGGVTGGASGGGGVWKSITSALGFADGGWTGGTAGLPRGVVHGEEFVVRAGPASQHRALLENINAGGSLSSGGSAPIALTTNYNFNGSGFTEAQARRMMADNNRELMNTLPGALADAGRRAVRGT